MTPPQFAGDIDRDARRALVEGRADLEGIDFVEVVSNHVGTPGHVPGAPSQRTLLVHLLNRAVPANWDRGRVAVTGGVRSDPRVNPVGIAWAYPVLAVAGAPGVPSTPGLRGVTAADRTLVDASLPEAAGVRERVLAVRTTTSGDWSTYVLHLLGDAGAGPPTGFDEPLAECPFSFTVDCPTDLDCAAPLSERPPPATAPVLDYLARDYDALRTRLLDRVSTVLPDWTDRGPADPAVMLVELFAYLGDRMAYWQDAVSREAFLGSAAQRTSVRRHARLLNYAVHEGCSARTWLALTTTVPTLLDAGAAVSDMPALAGDGLPVAAAEAGATVFETSRAVRLTPARNGMDLHSWGDPDHMLPAGARSAYLSVPTADGDPQIVAGDVLLLVDSPVPRPGGVHPSDPDHLRLGDPAARFAVRLDRQPVVHHDPLFPDLTILEVHWHAEDALPVPLRVAQPGPDGRPRARAVALANVVPADHGATVFWEPLVPPQPAADQPYRPRLARTGLAFAEPLPTQSASPTPDTRSAVALGTPDPRLAVAQVELDDGQRTWTPQADVIASGRLDPHVVVEPEDGVARLRFGDGRTGRQPSSESVFLARYRLGGGVRGNVAAGRLTRWLLHADGRPADSGGAQLTVWNPLSAAGGSDPEPLDAVRQLAPSAFRRQLRAVTADDYATAAQSVTGVQRSVARRRWTGSWYAVQAMVDPEADRADDPAVADGVTVLLQTRRMAGTDVEVVRPVFVPLHVGLFGCLLPGFARPDIRRQLVDVLSSRDLPDGRRGFFHPDRFTFGQAVYLSDLVAAAMTVPGLASVEVTVFADLGGTESATTANLAAGRIAVGPREVVRCDSDPNSPETGRVDIELGGGT